MNQNRARLVFLCGFPSSGTDLLKNLLNAHRQVYIGGEFPLLPSLVRRCGPTVGLQEAEHVVQDIVGCDIYGNLARRSIPEGFPIPSTLGELYVELLCPRRVRWAGNKTPQNSENVDRLEQLFPGSYYILIVRDVRDVALSWLNKWGKDPYLCAHNWNDRMLRAGQMLEMVAPKRHRVVSFEALLDDHSAVAREICRFLELEFDDRMVEYHRFVEAKVPGKINYGEAVIKRNQQKWRSSFSRGTVARIEEIAFDAMQQFGYRPVHAKAKRPLSLIGRTRGQLRNLLAMATVGNRAQDGRKYSYLRRVLGHELSKRLGRYRISRS